MAISKSEITRIAAVARGGYSTHRKNQVPVDHWLRSVIASKNNKSIQNIINKQKRKAH